MCGILGVLSSEPVEAESFERALQSLENRGPDGRGTWWSEDRCVALGHQRLAINDEAGGHQPLVDESSVCVVNGEFYNLPKEFQSRSDSLALPRLVNQLGWEQTLPHLRGEFAALYYCRHTKTLYALRDRFGIKPLFWSRRNSELWFASKASALRAAGLSSGWCENSFLEAASGQYPPLGSSLFQAIHSLRPAHYLQVQEQRLTEQRYWRVPSMASEQYSRPVESLQNSLRQAVQLRVRSGKKTAILLSGGVDSAAVCALAAQTGEALKAYTVDFPESRGSLFSEAELAQKQAEHVHISCQVLPLTKRDIFSNLRTVVQQLEGLVVNGHAVGKWKLAQAVRRDGCKVLLSGEGSDELFYGYRHFKPHFHQEVSLQDPAGLGILISRQKAAALPNGVPNFFHSKYHLGSKICAFLHSDLEREATFQRWQRETEASSPLELARNSWLHTALCTYILEVLGDGAEMAHSVEGRPPFLDHILWEGVAQFPRSAHDGEKTLLRQSLGAQIVDEIRHKPKHPFMAPPLGAPLLEALREQVLDAPHPFVHRNKTLELLARLQKLPEGGLGEWEPALLWLLSSYYLQETF